MIAVAAALLAFASPVVDRTLVCTTSGEGLPDPARILDVQAAPRLGSSPPSLELFNGPTGRDGLSVRLWTGPRFGRGTGFVEFNRLTCRTSRLRASLSTRGLRGGVVRLGDRYKCDVPATILIRVRAVFRSPVTLRAEKHNMIARGRIATGQFAVRTLRDRPIAFTSVDDATGKARLFTSRVRCFPA